MQSGLDRQKDVYLNGFAGRRSVIPFDPAALEQKAASAMSPEAYAYIAGGAGMESTMRANRSAFDAWRIVPRMLRDVSRRNAQTSLLNLNLPAPILLAPIGVLEMAHRDADQAVARAAASLGIPYIFSNQASVPMETVSAEMKETPRMFQLYWSKSRDLVASFVSRAEKCGCSAIVVTLDTTLLGWRTRDLDVAYLPFLEGKGIAQYTSDPVFHKLMQEPLDPPSVKPSLHAIAGVLRMISRYPGGSFLTKLKSGDARKAVSRFVNVYSNPAVTWADLPFLREHTKLPILLKGILHPDDARRAVDAGMDGIIVSNHGGRQVDGSIATMEALPAIVEAVNRKIPVLLDSGIRGGADVFKALALGASAVCLGRPYVYALALNGEEGVREWLINLLADFDLTMGLAGCTTVDEIRATGLVKP